MPVIHVQTYWMVINNCFLYPPLRLDLYPTERDLFRRKGWQTHRQTATKHNAPKTKNGLKMIKMDKSTGQTRVNVEAVDTKKRCHFCLFS